MRMKALVVGFVTSIYCATGTFGQCGVGDLNQDGIVNGADLGAMLGAWGTSASGADLDSNDTVDGADLALLLGNWGPVVVEGGTFPDEWIFGQCITEPSIQVHQFNANTFILRQSLCTNFEGPFIYLLFGQDKVLMEDTGASNIALYATVKSIIDQWLVENRKPSIQLIVSHSHAHGDHVFNDSQFAGKPNTTVVGTSLTAVKNFFGIPGWPTQIVDYDLGGRVVTVIPIPGHHSAHIAFYDHQTGWLLTGDTLYPGRLYISQWSQYKASIQRMVDYTADKTLCWVMGTHIEMSKTPGDDFPLGSTFHPDEHALQLTRAHLLELNDAVIAMGDSPEYEVHDDFIIFPLVLALNNPCPDVSPRLPQDDALCACRPKTVFEYRRLREALAK